MANQIFKTHSPEETKALAARFAKLLRPGDVLALTGDFGSGKTTFVKGLAEGLGVKGKGEVTSPSFVLLHEYSGRQPLYHIDCYRLEKPEEAQAAGLEEFFYTEAIVAVEWAEKIASLLPADSIHVEFVLEGEKNRSITISASASRLNHEFAK